MIKKWLFGVLAVSGVALSLAFMPFALANHVPTLPSVSKCYDINGQGKPVKVAGTANSGVISFDQAAGSPLHEYEACARNLTDTPDGPFRLEGWAWDSNLGWISFYCPSGVPGVAKNLGLDCSNVMYTGGYGVTIDKGGKFSGYAWGDNAGWISFKTVSNQVQLEAANPDCQGFVYGSTKPKPACPSHESMPGDGAKMTHAWSDNVGWIDLDGISIPWFTIAKKITGGSVGTPASLTATPPSLPPASPPSPPTPKPNGVTVQVFPDPTAFIEDKSKAPIANGSDKYTARINLFTVDGAPLTDERYLFDFEPKWQDTVKMDQTKSEGEAGAKANCNNVVYSGVTPTSAGCAVTKPLKRDDFKLLNLETLGGPKESGIYVADITAKAPTSLMNGIVKESGSSFAYETFISPVRKVEPNNLLLKNIKIIIVDKKTGESVFSQEVNPLARIGNLHFKPQAEITTLDDEVGKDIIKATINSESEFKLNSIGKGSAEFSLGFDDPDSSSITFKAGGATKLDFYDKSALTQFKATPVLNKGAAIGAYIKNPYLYTTLVDGVTGAKYYSNKLPRVEGGYIINPVAIFRGNIYASGLTNPSISQVLRSLGDVSTNIVRSAIVSNVARITTGIKGSFSSGPVTVNGFNTASGIFTFASSEHPKKLLPDNVKSPTVYYVKNGDLTIDKDSAGTDLTWTGARTFIVSGGNVYIKSNLYNGSSADNRPKLGIIVLKNLNSPTEEQKKQGNVYIAPKVTNIQANIFADGSVFSYDPTQGICLAGDTDCNPGEPKFFSGGDQSQQKVLEKTQLLIEGSVSSQNSVGGSLQDPPILGDGTKLSDSSKVNVARARLYDLNFLRWYGGKVKIDSSGKETFKPKVGGAGPKYTKSDGSPCSGEDDDSKVDDADEDKGCDIFPPFEVGSDQASYKSAFKDPKLKKKNLGAVYIYFDPPPANLPGFGVEAGAGQRQLQR